MPPTTASQHLNDLLYCKTIAGLNSQEVNANEERTIGAGLF
jgi:hypothetical protein